MEAALACVAAGERSRGCETYGGDADGKGDPIMRGGDPRRIRRGDPIMPSLVTTRTHPADSPSLPMAPNRCLTVPPPDRTADEQTDVAYQEVQDVVTVGRGIGLWGDMVVTLNNGDKVELRSLERWDRVTWTPGRAEM